MGNTECQGGCGEIGNLFSFAGGTIKWCVATLGQFDSPPKLNIELPCGPTVSPLVYTKRIETQSQEHRSSGHSSICRNSWSGSNPAGEWISWPVRTWGIASRHEKGGGAVTCSNTDEPERNQKRPHSVRRHTSYEMSKTGKQIESRLLGARGWGRGEMGLTVGSGLPLRVMECSGIR